MRHKNVVHGGDIYCDGIAEVKKFIDFSSNINPLGLPERFTEHIQEAIEAVTRYPDIKYRELLKKLSEYLGKNYITENNLVQGNGAAEIIDLVISCHKRVLIVVPSFVEYEENARKWGCQVSYSFLKEDMSFYYEDILEKLVEVDALIIGHPNNPNGNSIDKQKFKYILEFCEKNKKTVIIDEAFIEFTGNQSLSFVQEMEFYNCIFIIRALTKFFAMPGLRFGYGISKDERLISEIRKKLNPWNINCFAETAVKYVLEDENYIKNSLRWIEQEREFLPSKLAEIDFIEKVYETRCNYVLCKLYGIDSEELYGLCLERNIVIRRASNFRGLDNSFVRFAIKDRRSNEKLIWVLQQIGNNRSK